MAHRSRDHRYITYSLKSFTEPRGHAVEPCRYGIFVKGGLLVYTRVHDRKKGEMIVLNIVNVL